MTARARKTTTAPSQPTVDMTCAVSANLRRRGDMTMACYMPRAVTLKAGAWSRPADVWRLGPWPPEPRVSKRMTTSRTTGGEVVETPCSVGVVAAERLSSHGKATLVQRAGTVKIALITQNEGKVRE